MYSSRENGPDSNRVDMARIENAAYAVSNKKTVCRIRKSKKSNINLIACVKPVTFCKNDDAITRPITSVDIPKLLKEVVYSISRRTIFFR